MGGFVTIMTTNTIRIVPHTIANSCHHYRPTTCTVYSLVALYIVHDTRTGHYTTTGLANTFSIAHIYEVSDNKNDYNAICECVEREIC